MLTIIDAQTGYHGTSEIEHGMCACTVDNPLARARGLSLRSGAQTMLCLSLASTVRCNIHFEHFTIRNIVRDHGSGFLFQNPDISSLEPWTIPL